MKRALASSALATVKLLLDDLHNWQSGLPDELLEALSLSDVRWNLRHTIAAQYPDAQPVSAAIDATSDDQIEVMLEMDSNWLAIDGKWCAREPSASRAGAAGAEHLRALREAAKRPVAAERTLTYLVQLLRDPAYASVPTHRMLYQLTKILIAELVRTERGLGASGPSAHWAGSAVPDDIDWIPYADAHEARRHGPIDAGGWSFDPSGFKAGGLVVGDASHGVELQQAATCSGAGGASDAFKLRRSVCVAHGKAPHELQQTVAFAADSYAALRFLISRADGTAQRLRVLIDQLVPVVRAEESARENAENALRLSRNLRVHAAAAQLRATIRSDLDLIEAALETYALGVLSWIDGDPHPPSLESCVRPVLAELRR